MFLLKKSNMFSIIGVSIAGGVFHNLGQIIAAIIVMQTIEIGYYMIVLSISGIIAGIFVGIAGMYMLILLLPVFHQCREYSNKM